MKAEALAIVKPLREASRRVSAARRYATVSAARKADAALRLAWFESWRTYDIATDCGSLAHTADCCAVGRVYRAMADAPRRMTIRKIAKRILSGDDIACTDSARCACEACFTLGDWRETVRAYRDAQRYLRDVGRFAISRLDATPTVSSKFYRSVVKHWHAYTGSDWDKKLAGRHAALHGVTPDDIFQDGMVRAIESRDVDAETGIPVFAPLYMHMRHAVESAVYTYRRGHSHSADYALWTWADWQEWASVPERQDIALRVRYSTSHEWDAYLAARDWQDRMSAYTLAVETRRDAIAKSLDEMRQAITALIRQGWTVARIAKTLGRADADAIVKGLDIESRPIAEWLPPVPVESPDDSDDIESERRFTLGDIARAAMVDRTPIETVETVETFTPNYDIPRVAPTGMPPRFAWIDGEYVRVA